MAQQQDLEIVLDGVSHEYLPLDQLCHLALRLLERHRALAVNVLGSDAADAGAVVGHRLARLDVLVVHDRTVEVDDRHASERIVDAFDTDADELAVDGQTRSHTPEAEENAVRKRQQQRNAAAGRPTFAECAASARMRVCTVCRVLTWLVHWRWLLLVSHWVWRRSVRRPPCASSDWRRRPALCSTPTAPSS